MALERWRLEHGGHPESLETLVPRFLPGVPTDPWSGKPMGYRRTDPVQDSMGREILLYSLGPDGTDDGGKESAPADPGRVHRWSDPALTPIGFDYPFNRAAPVKRGWAPPQPATSPAD